ncbi:MAG: hypothetical protein RQ752_12350 [Thermohalobaculum sp.]|nr:hypothetical protein [Thermohalobaculum sp.]
MPHKWLAYPAILTDATWQKKKGAIAKIAGKTGVGDAMKAADKAYSDVLKNQRQMEIYTYLPNATQITKEGIDAALKSVVAYYNANVEGEVRKKVIALRDAAKKTAEKWEKNKLIPKDSAKYARDVEKAADSFMVSINKNTVLPSFSAEHKVAIEANAKARKVVEDATKKLKPYLVAVAKGMKTVSTKDDFERPFWSNDIRGVGTVLPLVAKSLGLETELKEWRKIASQPFLPADDSEVPEKMKEIAPVLKKIAAAVK